MPAIVDAMMTTSRVPITAHTDQPWRIHDIARDFDVEDVWQYRAPGAGPDDFPIMLDAIQAQGNPENSGVLSRALFAIRWKLGEILGWDDENPAVVAKLRAFRDRLPADLRGALPVDRDDSALPFETVYELPDECAMQIANKTVHGICHLGWVSVGGGEYRMQMAVLVKPNGAFGRAYMAAIAPFRYLIVYPALARQWERAWRERRVAS